MKKLSIKTILITILVLIATSCGSSNNSDTTGSNYLKGESVTIDKNYRVTGITDDAKVTMITNPETEKTIVTVDEGIIKVIKY